VLAPHGGLNVGPLTANGTKAAGALGLVTAAGGDLTAIVRDDILVNQSRVFTVGKGNLMLWSSQGNIDAGRGAKTVTNSPPPRQVLKFGKIELDTSGSFSGSGIAVLSSDSILDLYAPKGEINAGDAGIVSKGNAFFGATRFVGADNLAVSGSVAGGPTAQVSVTPISAPAAVNPQAGDASKKDADTEEKKRRKRRQVILDLLGFGSSDKSDQ
jgi:hypothetical protein